MPQRNSFRLYCLMLLLFPSLAVAGNKHVVELFTSQGCYSCPPADKFLGELIESRSDVIALEFHVDYWDDLVYGLAGKWKDPFSDADYTLRQRYYASIGLQGRNGVYTPQAVVNGEYATVGSNRKDVLTALKQKPSSDVKIKLKRSSKTLIVNLTGTNPQISADVLLVVFDHKQTTEVPSGENHGKVLKNYNVVRRMENIGTWDGSEQTLVVEDFKLTAEQGCAVLVQASDQRMLFGASSCDA